MDNLKDKILHLKQETILKSASKHFESDGYEHTKINDIAHEVGISVGAFYKIYASKDILFNAYIIYQVGLFYDEYKKIIDTKLTSEEKLKSYLQLKFQYYIQKNKAVEGSILSGDPLFYHKAYSGKENPMQQIYTLLIEIIKEIVPHKSDKELKLLTYTFHTMSDGAISLWFEEEVDLDLQINVIYNLFINGINTK